MGSFLFRHKLVKIVVKTRTILFQRVSKVSTGVSFLKAVAATPFGVAVLVFGLVMRPKALNAIWTH